MVTTHTPHAKKKRLSLYVDYLISNVLDLTSTLRVTHIVNKKCIRVGVTIHVLYPNKNSFITRIHRVRCWLYLALLHQGKLEVEDGFRETDNHPTSIGDLLTERNLGNIHSELVSVGVVSVSSGYNAIVIDNDNLFVRNLGLSVTEDAITVNIPRIRDLVVIENTLLLVHDHVLVQVSKINDAKFVGGHYRSREGVARRETIPFNHSDKVAGSWDRRNICNVSCIELKGVVSHEGIKGRRVRRSSISRQYLVDANAGLVSKSRVSSILFDESGNGAISEKRESPYKYWPQGIQ